EPELKSLRKQRSEHRHLRFERGMFFPRCLRHDVVMIVRIPIRDARYRQGAHVVCGSDECLDGLISPFQEMGARHPDVSTTLPVRRSRLDGGYFERLRE